MSFLLDQGVAFLLGLGGALFVERLRGVRQRRGLLRTLLAEIDHNEEITRTVQERRGERPEDMIGAPALLSLQAEAWHDAMQAGVLPDALFEELDGYYSPLQKLLSLQRLEGSAADFGDRWLRAAIAEKKPDWDIVLSRNPYVEYMSQVLEAQDRARDRITEYLARPWWRTILG